MAHTYRRPHQLAKLIGCSTEQVLNQARLLGLSVKSQNDLLPQIAVSQIRQALEIRAAQASQVKESIVSGAARVLGSLSHAPRDLSWPIIGNETSVISYLSRQQLDFMHNTLVDDFKKTSDPIEPPGVRDENLLESALFRPHTSMGLQRKYPTVAMGAAAYVQALIQNHPFHNGNKRTALVALLVFLDINGYILDVEQDELFNFLLSVAAHEIVQGDVRSRSEEETIEIARWIHRNYRFIDRSEKPLKFHELREILSSYDCNFEMPKRGNRMNIFRHNMKTQVYYQNEGMEVQVNTIHKIRADLHLTEDDGYDSTVFYRAEERIDEFIHRYRRTLDKLAKV